MTKKTQTRRSPTPAMRKKIFSKTGGRCHLCGEPLDDNRGEVDHVCPLAKGGDNDVNNCLPACRVCNAFRGNRNPANIRTILKLGLIARKLIRNRHKVGMALLRSKAAQKKLKDLLDAPDIKMRTAIEAVLEESR